MKANVNPFEPWRPTEAAVPPPIHASRPWRPIPARPVSPPAEEPPPAASIPVASPSAPAKRTCHEKRPRRQASKPCRMHRPVAFLAAFISQITPLILLTVLGILCFDCVGWLRFTHAPRLLVFGASGAILIGMTFNSRRSWYVRLRWMLIALSVAASAAWFVPTLRGVNLWSGYRHIEDLRTLPPGEVAEFQRGVPARRLLVEEFPSFAADVNVAEQAWLRRTVDEAIETADRQLETDPHRAHAALHHLSEALSQVQQYPTVRNDLEAARRRVLEACLKVAGG